MLKLGNAAYTKEGVLVVTDDELEAFAYAQLKDYDKDYFKTPHALDVDDFVENYLRRKVIYFKLSLDKSVLGVTAITDGKISVINSENKLDVKIFPKGTICIDLEACCSETRTNFTILHEAGHSQFDMKVIPSVLENKSIIQDTYLMIDGAIFKIKEKSSLDWMGHHANKYATYILMPKKFVVKLFNAKHKEYFSSERRLTKNRPQRTWLMISSIAEILGVSKKAMAYRLRDLHLISKEIFLSLELDKEKKEAMTICCNNFNDN